MKRRAFVAAVIAAPYVQAQTRQEKGKRAIEQVINALGGQAFLNMRTRVEYGRAYTFYRDALTGLSIAKIYTEYLDSPEPGKLGIRERQVFGKKEDNSILFLDGQGYDISYRGARPIPDLQLERYHQTTFHNVFYLLRQRLKEPGLIIEMTGQDVVENQPVDVIDITDSSNQVITVWAHSSTHLPVRQRWYRREEGTHYKYEEVTHFTKYRDAGGGIMWPLDLQRERDTEKLAEIYDTEVKINTELKAGTFQLPSNVKILPQPKA